MSDKLNINGFIGNPDNIYQQHADDTCAIKSQQLILKEYGINVSEEELVQLSMQNGWYTGDGSGKTTLTACQRPPGNRDCRQ